MRARKKGAEKPTQRDTSIGTTSNPHKHEDPPCVDFLIDVCVSGDVCFPHLCPAELSGAPLLMQRCHQQLRLHTKQHTSSLARTRTPLHSHTHTRSLESPAHYRPLAPSRLCQPTSAPPRGSFSLCSLSP